MRLEHNHELVFLSHLNGAAQTLLLAVMSAENAVELGGVRRDYRLGSDAIEQHRPLGDAVERIGIEHTRLVVVLEENLESIDCLFIGTDTGTESHGVVVVAKGYIGGNPVVVVALILGFGDADLQNIVTAAGSMHRHKPHTRAHGGTGGKHGGAIHPVAACHE